MKIQLHYWFLIFGLSPLLCLAQVSDSLKTVQVNTSYKSTEVTSPISVQILNTTESYKTNSFTVADALKHFAGVTVKDYGGLGGLKTVSVRSLGANHTGVIYDGLTVGDAQGGQVDLGKFSLNNIAQIELYNTGPMEILSAARSFSFGSLLSLKSGINPLDKEKQKNVEVALTKGSFNFVSSSLNFKNNMSSKMQSGFNASYQSAKNQYPFNSYENNSETKYRSNTDIKALKFEYDAAIKLRDSAIVKIKTYFYHSERGLPGAVILYNEISNQRLKDDNFFIQASLLKRVNKKSDLLLQGKFANDKILYTDPIYPNSFGKLVNDFHNTENYISASYKYKITDNSFVSYSSDIIKNKLKRTDFLAADFANPTRYSFLNNAAFQLKKQKISATANLLYTVVNEKTSNGLAGKNTQAFSGGLAVSYKPINTTNFYTRAYYKHVFRLPTFNDLYYTNIGNTNLLPEYADQFNAGITYSPNSFFIFQNISLTADVYLNKIDNKIISLPRQNLFQWSVQNIGKVNIKGMDIAVHASLKEFNKIKIHAAATYTYQQVLDVTDASSAEYKTQLPYTPTHSGSTTINVTFKKITFNHNTVFSSYRYKQGDAIFENILQPWITNDVSLSYKLTNNKKADFTIIAEGNNIGNSRFEVIKYYPMPGFNYRITLNILFKKQKKQ